MTDRRAELIAGDCLEVLATMPEASLDACVTDPPYGLEFMGKDWDRFSATAPILRVGWQQAGGVHQVAPERNSSPASAARVAFHKRRSTYRCSEVWPA